MLIALIASPIAAAALAEPTTAYDALHFPDTPVTPLKSPPLGVLHAADLPIRLEQTPLSAVQRRFGGRRHHGGDAAGAVTWLCYSRPVSGGATFYWFMSNDEMGGGTRITQVAVQHLRTVTEPSCGPAPNALRSLDLGVPAIGARLHEIQRRFGPTHPSDGYFSYGNIRSVGDAQHPDTTMTQSVTYHVANGVADTVSVQQVTAD